MKWISVKNRIPGETGKVIGYIHEPDSKSIGLINCYICPEYGFVVWETLDDEDVEGLVSHWMPLPKPPSGESDARA
jgi:hypothetical protein